MTDQQAADVSRTLTAAIAAAKPSSIKYADATGKAIDRDGALTLLDSGELVWIEAAFGYVPSRVARLTWGGSDWVAEWRRGGNTLTFHHDGTCETAMELAEGLVRTQDAHHKALYGGLSAALAKMREAGDALRSATVKLAKLEAEQQGVIGQSDGGIGENCAATHEGIRAALAGDGS